MNPFRISLAQLERQKKIHLTGDLPPSFLEMTDNEIMQFKAPINYDIEISATVGGVVVRGSADTEVECRCGRCLNAFVQEIEAEVCHFYEKSDDQELDISDQVREDVVLELPMNPLCDDECRGLCLKCGIDLNKKECECDRSSAGSPVWDELDKLNL